MENKYYWIKLPKDFFTSKRIKKLRSLAGGDTFTIIYLKMQLKSLSTGGVLEYTGIEPTFAEEIALDIDEVSENVAITINYLLSCGLMEMLDEHHLSLPFVKENTGSETKWAEKKREYRMTRQTQTEGQIEDTERTNRGHCPTEIEKEIEKYIEIEIDKNNKRPLLYYPNDEELDNAFKEFVEFRKKVRSPMTPRAIELAIMKLDKIAGTNGNKKIEIINQSILNGWKGLFDIVAENKKKGIDWENV